MDHRHKYLYQTGMGFLNRYPLRLEYMENNVYGLQIGAMHFKLVTYLRLYLFRWKIFFLCKMILCKMIVFMAPFVWA